MLKISKSPLSDNRAAVSATLRRMLILGFKACPAAIQGQRQLVRDGRRLIRLRYLPETSPAKKRTTNNDELASEGSRFGRNQWTHGSANGCAFFAEAARRPRPKRPANLHRWPRGTERGCFYLARQGGELSLSSCLLASSQRPLSANVLPPSSLRSEWAQPVRGRTGLASRATFREVGPFALYLFPGYFRRCCDALAKLAPGLPSFRARYELRR